MGKAPVVDDTRFLELATEDQKPKEENPYTFTFISDILNAPPIEWAIKNVLFNRTFSILGGYTGYGKSLLALSISKSITDGSPLFDRYTVNRVGKVLYIDEENSHSDLKDRIIRMGIKEDAPLYFLSFQGIRLDIRKSFNYLMEIIIKLDPILVVFDSLIRFHSANENDAGEMAQVMGHFREIVNAGPGVLVLHHHNKGMGPLEMRTRGSSDIVGICDVEYGLYRRGEDLVLSTVKSRRTRIEDIRLSIESMQDSLKIDCLGSAEDERKMMMLTIEDHLREKPSTLNEILEVLVNAGYGISINPLRNLLKEMLEKRYVQVDIGTRNRKTYSSPTACRTSFVGL
ncbi:MAG: AAA family ATPase [Spirochaetes bacterium]|nr:AAA family ATPase [Spirochaetota bacterium]